MEGDWATSTCCINYNKSTNENTAKNAKFSSASNLNNAAAGDALAKYADALPEFTDALPEFTDASPKSSDANSLMRLKRCSTSAKDIKDFLPLPDSYAFLPPRSPLNHAISTPDQLNKIDSKSPYSMMGPDQFLPKDDQNNDASPQTAPSFLRRSWSNRSHKFKIGSFHFSFRAKNRKTKPSTVARENDVIKNDVTNDDVIGPDNHDVIDDSAKSSTDDDVTSNNGVSTPCSMFKTASEKSIDKLFVIGKSIAKFDDDVIRSKIDRSINDAAIADCTLLIDESSNDKDQLYSADDGRADDNNNNKTLNDAQSNDGKLASNAGSDLAIAAESTDNTAPSESLNLIKNISASTPSIRDSLVRKDDESISESLKSQLVGEVLIAVDVDTPSSSSSVTLREKPLNVKNAKANNLRAQSTCLASGVAPTRQSLISFIPGTSSYKRQAAEKYIQNSYSWISHIEKNDETKEKNKSRKHGLFNHRPKSKEKRPHFWIKVNPTDGDRCETCSHRLQRSSAYQCNGCQSIVHSQCKELYDKTRCNKVVKLNLGPPLLLRHSDSNNDLSVEKAPIEEESEMCAGTMCPKEIPDGSSNAPRILGAQDSTGNEELQATPDDGVNLPSGFYTVTVPCAIWNEIDLWREEPESWSCGAGKSEKKKLSSKEIKRQDIIHELYITEKHHCQTLVVLKHTYFDEILRQKLFTENELTQLFPKLDDLLLSHREFLRNLFDRKRCQIVVDSISDVIKAQFSYDNGTRLANAYTAFCAQKDATDRIFHKLAQHNISYQTFASRLTNFPFYKSRSLRDCLLLVTQRLSKYHTLVENLRKNTPEDSLDRPEIVQVELLVKEILSRVDSGIENIQLQRFCIDLANNMDSKSYTMYGDVIFTPKDLVSTDRRLVYQAKVQMQSAKRIPTDVSLLLYTDVIVFVRHNASGLWTFHSQDKKPAVVPLHKMIVRDKAGRLGSDGVYLIATHPKPEMYELKCKTKKESQQLMARIQNLDACQKPSIPRAHMEEATAEKHGVSAEIIGPQLTDADYRQLDLLFDSLKPINEKLRDCYNGFLEAYSEIGSYVQLLATKLKSNEDRSELIRSLDNGFNAQTVNLNNLELMRAMNDAVLEASTDVIGGRIELANDDSSLADSTGASQSVTTTTTSTFDSQIGRSNTFHYIRSSDKRKGLRKHATVSGVTGADAKIFVLNSACPSDIAEVDSVSSGSVDEAKQRCSVTTVLKQINDSQAALNELKQDNLKLRCELALLRSSATSKAAEPPRHSDSYSTLEELRRLHADLNQKKQEFNQFVDDKQFDMNRREKSITEREMRLEREDNELRARWMHLFQVWEHQRLSGLPLAPFLGPPLPQHVPPPPAPIFPTTSGRNATGDNRVNKSRRNSQSAASISPASSSADMRTILEPSLLQRAGSSAAIIPSRAFRASAPPEYAFAGRSPLAERGFFAAGSQAPSTEYGSGAGPGSIYYRHGSAPMTRSISASDVPPALQGSLVHRRVTASAGTGAGSDRYGFVDHGFGPNGPRTVLPVKLCQTSTVTGTAADSPGSVTATVMTSSSVRNRPITGEHYGSPFVSRLHSIARHGSTAKKKLTPQLLPSKLSNLGGKKK